MSTPAKMVSHHLKHGRMQLQAIADSLSSDEIEEPTQGQRKRTARAQRKKEKAARKRQEKDAADMRLDRILKQQQCCNMRPIMQFAILAILEMSDDAISHAPTDVVADELPSAPVVFAPPPHEAAHSLVANHSDRTSIADATVTHNDLLLFQQQHSYSLSLIHISEPTRPRLI
eukprot:1825767-Amphidinium_carterae.1